MKKQCERNYVETNLINIEKDKFIADDYDGIIIGGPVYVERYPEILLRYVETHLKGYKGKCMLFSSQAHNEKNAVFAHALKRLKFLNITYCEFITMPNNFFNFGFKRISKVEETKIIRDSVTKSEEAINNFINAKEQYYPFSKFKVDVYNLVYLMFYKFFTHFLVKNVKVDLDKCIHCRLCERSCPMKAISINDGGVRIKNTCLLCQRCMSNCPKGAFKYKGNEFIQYHPDFKQDIKGTSNEIITK